MRGVLAADRLLATEKRGLFDAGDVGPDWRGARQHEQRRLCGRRFSVSLEPPIATLLVSCELYIDVTDGGLLRQVHDTVVALWRCGSPLPIEWTLVQTQDAAAMISGTTCELDDDIVTTTSDSVGGDVEEALVLPAYLIATDAGGRSTTAVFAPSEASIC